MGGVVPLAAGQARKRPPRDERDRWLRHQAVRIIEQLPENEEEARKVLDYAGQMYADWFGERPKPA